MIEHTKAACPAGAYGTYVEDTPSAFQIATRLAPLLRSALKSHGVWNAGLEW
jgi:hypothetical protein